MIKLTREEIDLKICNSVIIYGLSTYEQVIDQIQQELKLEDGVFDVKLILTEAITNAFLHGNKGDVSKPINILYSYDGGNIHIEVQDCGEENKQITIPKELSLDSLMDDSGRGLYLINCFSDSVQFSKNKLIVDKNITRTN